VTLVSVQSFGLASPGGGPRILRALYADPPVAVLNVATQPRVPPPVAGYDEVHLALRPALGPVEGSRAMSWARALEPATAALLRRRLADLCMRRGARAVHAVAHELEFWPAFRAAQAAGLPFFLSVHDDLHYNYDSIALPAALRRLGRAWREAEHRFVISGPMGEECCARHGRRSYTLVTDGLERSAIGAVRPVSGLRVYFAGLFHRSYGPNLRGLANALSRLSDEDGGRETTLTCRCGSLPVDVDGTVPVRTLPFGDEQDVHDDLARADLLYLPLPFDEAFASLVDFSLSTKLITYLGSGRPIVYHGPARGAAHDLLARHDAAIMATCEDPASIAAAIVDGLGRSATIVGNALRLARSEFLLEEQRRRFWTPILAATG
jgi:hypothetical protein